MTSSSGPPIAAPLVEVLGEDDPPAGSKRGMRGSPTPHASLTEGLPAARPTTIHGDLRSVSQAGSGTREVVGSFLAAQGMSERDLNKSLELGSPEAIKGAVEAGMGISIVSRAIIGKELKLGTLLARSLEPPLQRPFSFVRQRQKFRHGVMEEFLDFARRYCQAQESASA